MKNANYPSLDLVPVGGVDANISCDKCPSACCRAGVSIPLTKNEALTLKNAGTELRLLAREELKGRRAGIGKKVYELMSNCGNLLIDEDTGKSSCTIHNQPNYPNACGEFLMGGYQCAKIQQRRVELGQDTLINSSPLC